MRRARTRVDRPSVGNQAGDDRRVGLVNPARSQRTFVEAVTEQRAQFFNVSGIERSGYGGGPDRGHRTPDFFGYGATISTCKVPMPSTSPSTLSPGLRNTGGPRAKPTPRVGPVLMISPGSRRLPA